METNEIADEIYDLKQAINNLTYVIGFVNGYDVELSEDGVIMNKLLKEKKK